MAGPSGSRRSDPERTAAFPAVAVAVNVTGDMVTATVVDRFEG